MTEINDGMRKRVCIINEFCHRFLIQRILQTYNAVRGYLHRLTFSLENHFKTRL